LFAGYYHDEAATRSVVDGDGWFSTGDIAETDAEGYWYITGRKKELIVSSNGKKIYPSRIENLFKMEPLVNQVVLVGDKKPYVTALLTLNLANLKDLKSATPAADAAKTEPVNKALSRFRENPALQNTGTRFFDRARRTDADDEDSARSNIGAS
jgi:long-chain acyl-CoA synthetase